MMKKILNRAVWILVFILTMSVVIWANIERSNSHCTDIEIKMKATDYPSLTSSAAIKTNILETMPALIGQSVKNIELDELEQFVSLNSRLGEVKAFLNMNGIISIKVKPRQAVLRIFDKKGQNLYLGNDQVLMNSTVDHTQRILVANGHIPHLSKEEKYDVLNGDLDLPSIYSNLYSLAKLIHQDEFLDALIDQIYVTKNQEFDLTPKVGVKTIHFGKAENIEEKLENLRIFYINGQDKIDWQKYRSINIKFRNQIVCSKK